MTEERIKAAALLLEDGEVITKPPPARHPSLFLTAQARGKPYTPGTIQGFITTNGDRFVDRKDAFRIASREGQFITKPHCPRKELLYSEDLW